MQAQIPKGEIIDAAGNVVSKFSGRIERDRQRDSEEGFGVADAVRLIVAAIDERGRGLSIRFTEPAASAPVLAVDEAGNPVPAAANVAEALPLTRVLPIRIRDVSIKTRAVWFNLIEQSP